MNKLLQVANGIVVVLESGFNLVKTNVSKEEIEFVKKNLQNTESLNDLFYPERAAKLAIKRKTDSLLERINNVPFLSISYGVVTWNDVSPLSMPSELVTAVVESYEENNERALNAYKNFWILLSLNPSDECRRNLLWFLNIHGLQLCSSGCFIAYRNADKTNRKDDEGNPIYTDHHSGTTSISIGHTVTLDRSKCDENNQVMCSRGLICSPVY